MSENSSSENQPVRRVCILTGGGDAPGLNPVLRAFVKTALDLDIEVFGAEDGFEGLIQPGRLVRDAVEHGAQPLGVGRCQD